MAIDLSQLTEALQTAREQLLAEREDGVWVGELASSALSTATAVSALCLAASDASQENPPHDHASNNALIARALAWLADRQNPDGGWGDTDKSLSNIATTMLVRAAFTLAGRQAGDNGNDGHRLATIATLDRAAAYVASRGGIAALRRRYGRDKTFAVPILTNCALAGLVPWREVSPLPFELACFPQSWFRFLRLPVVSYAIPALVAIGQARYFHRKPWFPPVRWWRRAALHRSLAVVEQMQPESGGFLEATPLTSFVVMSLASIGQADHPVVRRGVRFLVDSVRLDGSWPIDTNLATWNTTLSINALAPGIGFPPVEREDRQTGCLSHESSLADENGEMLDWLLACQHRRVHPYTGAAPGGWAWTDLSGGVPDVDDTSGAMLALASVAVPSEVGDARPVPSSDSTATLEAAAVGANWLLDLQNRDGGWPTFCRGWGTMPFDRSATDLTAHAMRAMLAWHEQFTRHADRVAPWLPRFQRRYDRAIRRGFAYLRASQHADGSWAPLWFGNQHHPDEENPVYGTARVLLAYRDFGRLDTAEAGRGFAWLASRQNADGGWGGRGLAGSSSEGDAPAEDATYPLSTVEETALAVEALLSAENDNPYRGAIDGGAVDDGAVNDGIAWLVDAVGTNRYTKCSPIGFYFAKLWYYERLYPRIFTVSALGQAVRQLAQTSRSDPAQPSAVPSIPK